jgi:hypothetical protein
VGTGFGLVAFIVATLLYAYRARLGQRAEIIKSAPAEERLAAIETTAELFHVDLTGQTSRQRQEIVLRQIQLKARRELLVAGIALVIAVLLAAVSIVAMEQATSEKTISEQTTSAPPSSPVQSDSVKWQRVGPRPDSVLKAGQAADIELDMVYVLGSADRAFLMVYAEEFDGTAGGCVGQNHQTNGATQWQAVRGEHYVTLKVHWPGRSGSGFLAVGASLWKDVDGHPTDEIAAFGLFPDICYRFGP